MKQYDKAKVGIISLGCPRNLVDSEVILGILKKDGFNVTDLNRADIGIINTCAFIDEAKKESIDTILQVVELKKAGSIKKIVVSGCLPQRYKGVIASKMPEVDAFIGCNEIRDISKILSGLSKNDKICDISQRPYFIYSHKDPRLKITPDHFAYVKISEGCKNICSFCVIPKIRGDYRSRLMESILEETEELSKKTHTSEINLIGQDTTLYGMDRYGRPRITDLLKELCNFNRYKRWIRLLYTYPSHIDDELIELFSEENAICKYMDIPIQHINDRILKAMNRHMSKKDIVSLIEKIRKKIPAVTLRSSLIVGFPGESEGEFKEIVDFIEEVKFERLGVFTYSREEGTPAYKYKNQIEEKVKLERFNVLMSAQRDIAEEVNKSYMGKIIEVLIDEKDGDSKDTFIGRTEGDAPEVDGNVFVKGSNLKPGDFVKVKIADTLEYDLVGEQVK